MINIFSDEIRRNPYPVYDRMRNTSPCLRVPPPFDAWMVFDYESVKWMLNDHETFSSAVPAPPNWFIFFDAPRHTKLRGLISQAFTPRMIADLEPQIRGISRELLDRVAGREEIDLAAAYAVPLPMMVIARIIGLERADWACYTRWSDIILRLSYTRSGGEEAEQALRDFAAVTAEMSEYVDGVMEQRRVHPRDDLLTRLMQADVDGDHLTKDEILGFLQLLVVAGQETTSDLINNAMLSLLENPDQLALLRSRSELMPRAIEEVLRYRSPLQWMMRKPRRDVELNGQTIPAGRLVLPMIGSANRDPRQFAAPDRFDITRDPNPHIAFGHGIHFCLGAALSRMEARIALSDMLARFPRVELASSEPWEPRKALHVYGPASLRIRLDGARQAAAATPHQ